MSNKLSIRPAPSPNNTNREHLYLKTEIVRGARLGQDAAPALRTGRIIGALKAKGYTPRSVLAKLGLDASLLVRDSEPEETVILRREGMSAENIQKLIDGHVGRSDVRGGGGGSVVGSGYAGDDLTAEQIVDKYGSFDDLPPKIETMPEQNMSADDDDPYEEFSSYLRARGMSEDAIRTAVDAHKSMRRGDRKPNGHDRRGRDSFPVNRVLGSERTPPTGGRFGGERAGRFADGSGRHAMDEGRKERLAARFPNLARIQCEPEVRGDRRRHATMDAARVQTDRQRVRLLKRFPGMAGIKTSADTNYAFRDEAPARGRYEV
jgi:hypothetical protein